MSARHAMPRPRAAAAAAVLAALAAATQATRDLDLPAPLPAPPAPRPPPLPVVLWHGMGDSCCSPHSLGAVAAAIKEELGPGAHVLSLSPGGAPASPAADVAAGFFGRVDSQVAAACGAIAADARIRAAGAYNAVGFSQGGQFLRAVAQRCGGNEGRSGEGGQQAAAASQRQPALRRLVTLGAQHQGVASLPLCPLPRNATAHAWSLCAAAAALAALGADAPGVRTHLVQAQYWKDPAHLAAYRRLNAFLADINNEHACDAPPPTGGEEKAGEEEKAGGDPAGLPTRCPNPAYAPALAALDRLVLVRFARDATVVPRDSAWFSDVAVGTDGGVRAVPLRETALFKEDWIGLARLDARGGLWFEEAPGGHMQFSIRWFVDRVVRRHLVGGEAGEGRVSSV
jgi:palmitoyl-protein thioesterase